MSLFKKHPPAPARAAWVPTVDLDMARPIVFALANAPASDSAQVSSAIAAFVRASGHLPLEKMGSMLYDDPDVPHRPWIWLAAVMQDAIAAADHHVATAALFWACYWTYDLVPRNNASGFVTLNLFPIPGPRKAQLASLGVSAARELPEDFVVVGDTSGAIMAGPLADTAADLLGI